MCPWFLALIYMLLPVIYMVFALIYMPWICSVL